VPGTENLRDRILDAAGDLIVNDGFAALTMRAVASRAGVDESEIDELYPAHEQLLMDLLNRENDGVRRAVADNVERDEAGGLLSRIFHYTLSAIYERPLARSLYLLDPDGLRSIIRATHDTEFFPRMGIDLGFLTALQQGGMIRDDVDVRQLTATLSSFTAGTALTAPHDDIDDVIAGLVTLLERAVDAEVADTEPGKRALADLLSRSELR
jgi:AcrR family transcriptional regulator